MRSRFAFVVGMTFLALPGCLYHSGYYPNGYYGPGPSVLPSQPWTGYPNGPVYQQPGGPYQPVVPMNQPGTFPTPIGGDPYVPGGSSPGTSTPSNPTYGNPGSAPTFNATPGNSGGTSVPNPDDDNGGFNRGTQRPTITPTSGARRSDDDTVPSGEQNSTRRPRNFDDSPVTESDSPFETPVVQVSNTNSAAAEYDDPEEKAEPVQVSSKKYAYDPRFAWVQGVVEYDDTNSTWVIMYNDNPRTSDVYGGELTLADSPAVARLRSGSVVRIYGSLDPSEPDSRGRPLYRVTRIDAQKLSGR